MAKHIQDIAPSAGLLWEYDVPMPFTRHNIPMIRHELDAALERSMVTPYTRHRLGLTLSEILSNLLQHPHDKASTIHVAVFKTEQHICLQIQDNSTAFHAFKEKAEVSRLVLQKDQYALSGRGLGLITTQHSHYNYTPGCLVSGDMNSFTAWEDIDEALSPSLPRSYKENRKKVFLIDDDDISLQILKVMLEEDFEVIDFMSAQNALEAFEHEKPDLVISDLVMPDMDGVKLREELSHKKDGNTTPFVFVSAHQDASENLYINQIGIDDFIYKPVKKQKLKKCAHRLITRTEQIKQTINGQFGKDITNALKPCLPERLSGWRAIVKTSVAEQGGGDFILHSEHMDGSHIILSDVMGHGLQAKFFAYAYAGYLRGLFRLYKKQKGTKKFLENLSQAVFDDPFLNESMMTCLSLFLYKDGQIDLSAAGHPWPILLKHDTGESIFLKASGALVGLTPDMKYLTQTCRLRPKDRIILYTDGFMEGKSFASKYKENQEKLLYSAKNNFELTLFDYTNNLWATVLNSSTELQDDTTLVVLEYVSGDDYNERAK